MKISLFEHNKKFYPCGKTFLFFFLHFAKFCDIVFHVERTNVFEEQTQSLLTAGFKPFDDSFG